MCGIHAVISRSARAPPLTPSLKESLGNRGPDYFGQHSARLTSNVEDGGDDADSGTFLTFTSTVLSLRGGGVTRQPFVHSPTGSVLCWNGEAWKVGGQPVEGNDGEAVFGLLCAASVSEAKDGDTVLEVLRSIRGPFAFVYFDGPTRRVLLGRDRLGRRSLLVSQSEDGRSLAISSVADGRDPRWREVEADGIYVLNLCQDGRNPAGTAPTSLLLSFPSRTPWLPQGDEDMVLGLGQFNMSLPTGDTITTLASPSDPVRILREQLLESLSQRILNIPPPLSIACATTTPTTANQPLDTRMAILFSGGLDCMVLARLSHDLLPKGLAIDLVNVAFENPRIASHMRKQAGRAAVDVYEACPDRMTGRRAFAELREACPERVFRFVAVDVPYAEAAAHRSQVVSLMYPHDTEMDLSIALALYFAARGKGRVHEGDDDSAIDSIYRTPARVLLSGLGADELFGGYARHAAAYSRRGYEGLAEELKLDVGRLGKRNLGRDDRVTARWGREVRFPYLDEELVRWAMGRPAWEKCDFDNDGDSSTGVEPGKRVLRLLALELGLPQVAREKKRAIQFGSRTAKMESNRVKGTAQVS